MDNKLGVLSKTLSPFWGDITSTIDWCEPNYQLTRFVAEPLNTFSNLSFVLLGLLGAFHEATENAKRSYIFMYLTVVGIGFGSMAFHGTLTFLGQQLDELPMVWFLLGSMFVVNNDAMGTYAQKSLVSVLLLVYALVFSAAHIVYKTTTAFQVHFAGLLALLLLRVRQRFRTTDVGEQGRSVIKLFVASGLLAFACWLADYHGCSYFSNPTNWPFQFVPNGHVWWHLLMGYCAYCSVVMLKVLESSEKAKPIEIRYHLGIPLAYKIGQYDLERGKGSQIF